MEPVVKYERYGRDWREQNRRGDLSELCDQHDHTAQTDQTEEKSSNPSALHDSKQHVTGSYYCGNTATTAGGGMKKPEDNKLLESKGGLARSLKDSLGDLGRKCETLNI